MIKITMTNSCDTQNVMYQTGYTQEVYLNGVFGAPSIQRDQSARENGHGNQEINFSKTLELWTFETTHIADPTLISLKSFRDLDSMMIKRYAKNASYEEKEVRNFNITFRDQEDGCFNTAVLTFEVDSIIHESCCNDMDIGYCP